MKVSFTPRSLLFINKDNNSIIIDENNFEFLQNALSSIFCLKTGPMDQQNFNPVNAEAKRIADKLMRGRQRVAAQKGEGNTSILTQYASTLTVGLNSMSLQDVLELTMY